MKSLSRKLLCRKLMCLPERTYIAKEKILFFMEPSEEAFLHTLNNILNPLDIEIEELDLV